MNKERMYAVAEAIEKEQIAKFDMCDFVIKKHTCRTAACVCGFAAILEYPENTTDIIYEKHNGFMHFGMNYFDITDLEADELFVPASIGYVNANYQHVPNALRWMADNNIINWNKAFIGIGQPNWKDV